MRRGEVWWVNFDPSVGSEIRKIRPAVIISNDASNSNASRLQVVPLSSKIEKLYPCEAYVTVNGAMSKAMADQVATVSKQRLGTQFGVIAPDDLIAVERVLRLQLGLD